MKSLRPVLASVVVLVVFACNLSAQSSSSAKQTVTFGVHRIAPVLLASAQSSALTPNKIVDSKFNSLKVSVGSTSKLEMSVDLGSIETGSLSKATTPSGRSSYTSKKFSVLTSDQSVVTLTE